MICERPVRPEHDCVGDGRVPVDDRLDEAQGLEVQEGVHRGLDLVAVHDAAGVIQYPIALDRVVLVLLVGDKADHFFSSLLEVVVFGPLQVMRRQSAENIYFACLRRRGGRSPNW